MKENILLFRHEVFGEIRTLTDERGEPLFVGKDVAKALGYSNTRKALLDHVDYEDKRDGVTIRDSIGRDQKAVVINESGLYSLILSSKLPQAR
jgi:prophage antirepressor-like protein